MSLDWLLNNQRQARWWVPAGFLVFLLITLGLALVVTPGTYRQQVAADLQRVGTIIMFVVLPVYLVVSIQQLSARTLRYLEALKDSVDSDLYSDAVAHMLRLPVWSVLLNTHH